MQIIRTEWVKLPFWMGLVVSTVPTLAEHDVADKYCETVRLEPLLMDNKEDVRQYCAASLRPRMLAADIPRAVDVLVSKSDGLFLYIGSVMRSMLASPRSQLTVEADVEPLPVGIFALFEAQLTAAMAAWKRWVGTCEPAAI